MIASVLGKKKDCNILVPRFDTLGDIVLLQPLVARLLRDYPDAHITLVARPQYVALQSLFPAEISWVASSVNPYGYFSFSGLLKTISDLREREWDVVLTTAFNRTVADELLVRLLGEVPNLVLGEEGQCPHVPDLRQANKVETFTPVRHYFPVSESLHETEKYQLFYEWLTGGKSEPLPDPKLEVDERISELTQGVLSKIGLGKGDFAVSVPAGTANVRMKAWPADNYGDLISWLEKEYGLRTLILGHVDERPVIERVSATARGGGASPETWLGNDDGESIPLLAGLLGRSVLYVGNDTGPMHMAAALGVPVVAVFGGGHWPRFTPRGPGVVAVQRLPCFNCNWECVFGDAPCVRLLKKELLRKAVSDCLRGAEGPQPVILHADVSEGEILHHLVDSARSLRSSRLDEVEARVSRLGAQQEKETAESEEAERSLQLEVGELERKIAESEEAERSLQSRVRELSRELAEMEERKEVIQKAKEQQVAFLQEKLSRLQGDLSQVKGELTLLQGELTSERKLREDLINRKERLSGRLAEVERELDVMRSSLSWKVTKPLRKIWDITHR